MHVFNKGDVDYHDDLNDNFAEVSTNQTTAIEAAKTEIKQHVSNTYEPKNVLSKGETLWTGGLIMSAAHTIQCSKTPAQCNWGYALRFSRYNPSTAALDENWSNWVYINKSTIGNIATPSMTIAGEDKTGFKVLGINNAGVIAGHSSNDPGVVNGKGAFVLILKEVKSV